MVLSFICRRFWRKCLIRSRVLARRRSARRFSFCDLYIRLTEHKLVILTPQRAVLAADATATDGPSRDPPTSLTQAVKREERTGVALEREHV